jgi:uncharacterized oxidoreductase
LLIALVGGSTSATEGISQSGNTVNNMLLITIEPARLHDTRQSRTEVDRVIEYLRQSTPRASSAPVVVPGDPERAARVAGQSTGVSLPKAIWNELLACAAAFGVSARSTT